MTAAHVTSEQVQVDLAAMALTLPCPRCGTLANRIHRRYQRTLADLPMIQRPVVLILHVRRFFVTR
jgi:transposase